MIFSIICEETGLVGACLVMLAFGLLICGLWLRRSMRRIWRGR